jgi:hypothetical protein
MLNALNDAGAEYLVVVAHALATYGPARATGDFDSWVRPTKDNAEYVSAALAKFGAPRRKVTDDDVATPNYVYQVGVAPNGINILTSIYGAEFEEAWQHRKKERINGIVVLATGRQQLLKYKRATGRPRDLADIAWLEEFGT